MFKCIWKSDSVELTWSNVRYYRTLVLQHLLCFCKQSEGNLSAIHTTCYFISSCCGWFKTLPLSLLRYVANTFFQEARYLVPDVSQNINTCLLNKVVVFSTLFLWVYSFLHSVLTIIFSPSSSNSTAIIINSFNSSI